MILIFNSLALQIWNIYNNSQLTKFSIGFKGKDSLSLVLSYVNNLHEEINEESNLQIIETKLMY